MSGYEPYDTSPYGETPSDPTSPAPSAGVDKMDGVSLAALITSLTCCAAPVAVGLGIGGLVRTSGGKRRGRWAATTGLVLGGIGTLALIAAFVGLLWVGFNTVPEDEAEVGQCVDISRVFDANDLWKASCDEPHDAEVVAVGELTSDQADRLESAGETRFCEETAAGRFAELADDATYDAGIATDGNAEEPVEGEPYVCFYSLADGQQLDGQLVD